MASDPAVSGKDAVRALKKLGFRLDRVEGSHHMLVKPGHPYTVVVLSSRFAGATERDSGKYHSNCARWQEAVLRRDQVNWPD
jgi:predicted RNA binding protein YcfA (HicA-like mRNA interferase family)